MLHLNRRMSCCFSIMSADVPSLTVLQWESQNSTSKLCVGVRQNEKFPTIPSSFVYATRTFFNFPHLQFSPRYPYMGLAGLRGIYSVKPVVCLKKNVAKPHEGTNSAQIRVQIWNPYMSTESRVVFPHDRDNCRVGMPISRFIAFLDRLIDKVEQLW